MLILKSIPVKCSQKIFFFIGELMIAAASVTNWSANGIASAGIRMLTAESFR